MPIPTAGLALGLVALGILLQPISEVFHLMAGLLSLIAILAVTAKAILFPAMIKEDFKNPVLAAVSATYFMTIMQLATYLAPFALPVAFVIWIAAIVGHLSLIVFFTVRFTLHFDLKQVFPTHFIAYVGIIVAALTSPAFGMQALGEVIFWFGFACYLALLAVITLRYLKHEVPEPSKPLFCIYTAPMSLSLAGYLAVSAQPNLIMVAIMALVAQAFLVFVLIQLPKLLRLKFYPSYAAMTFPFVISASALLKATTFFESLGYSGPFFELAHILAVAETLFASVMVLYVFARYLHFLLGDIKDYREMSWLAIFRPRHLRSEKRTPCRKPSVKTSLNPPSVAGGQWPRCFCLRFSVRLV